MKNKKTWNEAKNAFSKILKMILEPPRQLHDIKSYPSDKAPDWLENKVDHGKHLVGRKKHFLTFLLGFRLLGGSFLFIIFEITLYSVIGILGTGIQEIWTLQIWALTSYGFFLYITWTSSHNKFARLLKFIQALFMFVVVSCAFFGLLLFFKYLRTLKIILGILTGYYFINMLFFLRTRLLFRRNTSMISLVIVGLLLSSNYALISTYYFTPTDIKITPQGEPELVFLCSSWELPEDPQELKICRQYNVAFMPVICREYLGNQELLAKYKKILSYNISLYFLMGGKSCFYAYIHNSKEFHSIYENMSVWFKAEGILSHPALKSIFLDAETPEHLLQEKFSNNISASLNEGLEEFPSEYEKLEATEDYIKLINRVHQDNKSCGMVRPSYFFDTTDQDGDLSLYTNNIYTLDIPWDQEITMCYRTHYLGKEEGVFDPPRHVRMSYKMFLGGHSEEDVLTMSEYNFYQVVNVEKERAMTEGLGINQYFFIGNFDPKFANTRYIRERAYYTDVDVCRHFETKKVFFYDLLGFLYHYGWQGIVELGLYLRRQKTTYIRREGFQSIFFVLYCCGMVIMDRFAFLESEQNHALMIQFHYFFFYYLNFIFLLNTSNKE